MSGKPPKHPRVTLRGTQNLGHRHPDAIKEQEERKDTDKKAMDNIRRMEDFFSRSGIKMGEQRSQRGGRTRKNRKTKQRRYRR